ncbi:spore coat U domain-containing protein [Pseudomonas sp. GD04058]|uniref:Csu type fimbrial protein n=1 Tax=Pseudomonas sp. GD04058 TaxID=2975429 RepID=UPI00244976B7|nr:spore coat U domain-containing protein [Pseudomonas sp. GD04058]MDG9883409.1 spore coat U domain-containing protein [Pseudomonas sp. GD04058]
MKPQLNRFVFAGIGLLLASQVQAATVTGQINASLVLISSCQVNGSTATTGVNFGALNFGTQTALFTTAGAQVLAGGGGAMSILCSNGAIPVIKIGAGAHDGASTGGTRALADGSGNSVPYDFYSDSGLTTVIPINGTITLPTSSGTPQTVNLYGKAVGKAGLPPGTYTDTVAVELSF